MKNLFFLAIALISISLTSCGDQITGEGMVVTQDMDVDDFKSIELKSSYDVTVKQGNEFKVTAEGQQNIIDRLELNVSNNNLTLDLQDGNYRNIELTVHITMPEIEHIFSNASGNISVESISGEDAILTIDGSGNINVTGLIDLTDEMTIVSDGSGDMKINNLISERTKILVDGSGQVKIDNGSTNELNATNDGSGDMKVYELESENCIVTAKGSGDTQVTATNDLIVTLTGSGDVKYKGNPSIDVTDSGSGDLINAN